MPLTDYRALTARTGIDAGGLLLVRPLLAEPRAEIESYCAEHDLHPRIDSTNADTRIYRNRLRHDLLPILRTYNPHMDGVLARTAEVMAGDHEVLQDATEAALAAVAVAGRGISRCAGLSICRPGETSPSASNDPRCGAP